MKKIATVFTIYLLWICIVPSGANAQNILYGLVNSGGAHDFGVLFKYNTTTETYTKVMDLDSINGSWPIGSMIQASNGKMYGMMNSGGAKDWGVIFEFNPATETYTKKLELDSLTNGCWPWSDFTEAPNGKLYGLVSRGATKNWGTLIEYDPSTNTLVTKLDLGGSSSSGVNGSVPKRNNLVLAPNGKFYGMVYAGSNAGRGMLFEYDYMTDTYTPKVSFGQEGAYNPYGSLILANNGKFYGLLNWGGVHDYGVIFEYDYVTDTYTKKIDLDSINTGSYPTSSLIKASNGKLYAMINSGGTDDAGLILEYDPATNIAMNKVDFDYDNDGAWSWGELTEVSNGVFYGMLNSGGINDYGTIIRYDLNSNILTKELDFNGTFNGAWPNGYMTIYKTSTGIMQKNSVPDISFYPNPVYDKLIVDMGKVYKEIQVAVSNVQGQEIIRTKFINSQLLNLNVANLVPGIYSINTYTPEKSVLLKMVKK